MSARDVIGREPGPSARAIPDSASTTSSREQRVAPAFVPRIRGRRAHAGAAAYQPRYPSLAALLVALVAVAALLAGCGSHGHAAPLGAAGHATLPASQGSSTGGGSATFTPFYATHIAPYYQGHAVTPADSRNPVVLVQGSCGGAFVAALTAGVPAPDKQPSPSIATAPDPSGGMDVAVASSTNLYVEVLDHPNDPNASVVACGHPLSGLRQFFDLYPPSQGSNGIGRGTALMEPVIATRLEIKPPSGWYSMTSTWAVHTGSCTGADIASGTIHPGVSPVEGVVFHPLDTQHWWLSMSRGANAPPICGQVTP